MILRDEYLTHTVRLKKRKQKHIHHVHSSSSRHFLFVLFIQKITPTNQSIPSSSINIHFLLFLYIQIWNTSTSPTQNICIISTMDKIIPNSSFYVWLRSGQLPIWRTGIEYYDVDHVKQNSKESTQVHLSSPIEILIVFFCLLLSFIS